MANKDIDSAKKLIAQIDRIPHTIGSKLQKEVEKMKVELRTYPPPPPNSRYIRTGDLGRSWHSLTTTDKISKKVDIYSEDVEYAPYVQMGPGDESPTQAWMHKNRWTTHTQVATQHEDNIESLVIDELVRLMSA